MCPSCFWWVWAAVWRGLGGSSYLCQQVHGQTLWKRSIPHENTGSSFPCASYKQNVVVCWCWQVSSTSTLAQWVITMSCVLVTAAYEPIWLFYLCPGCRQVCVEHSVSHREPSLGCILGRLFSLLGPRIITRHLPLKHLGGQSSSSQADKRFV